MNRRGALMIMVSAWLCTVFPASQAAAQQTEADNEGVKAASKAFYTALAVIDNGEAMEKVWAQTPYVTFVGPRSKSIIRGWDAQKKYWAETNKAFASRNVSLSESYIHVNGNLAWEMGEEVGESKMKDGTVGKTNWIVTNVYEKQADGRWLMVSHHVQPKPQ
jgi:ketosteroid isomerase-like protein